MLEWFTFLGGIQRICQAKYESCYQLVMGGRVISGVGPPDDISFLWGSVKVKVVPDVRPRLHLRQAQPGLLLPPK